jgi:protein arginine kinase
MVAPTSDIETSKLFAHNAPWDKNENVIWLASNLALHRNIEKFKFPQKMELERKRHLLSLLQSAFLEMPHLKKPFIIKLEECSPLEKNFLLEHFLLFDGIQEGRGAGAFILDETTTFLALLNIKDHICLECLDTSGDLEKTWDKLVAIENSLQPSFNFAFSKKFGFLTADPMLCGTGLTVTAYLHLPALIHTGALATLLEQEKNEAIIYSSLQGDPEDLIGDILTLRNAYTIGINEETIITTLRNSILKLVLAEKSARSKAKSEHNTLLQDKISRALGTLKFSYQLETVEALASLSLIKLGIEMEYIKEMSVQEVNRLFFTTRNAHLAFLLCEKFSNEEAPIKRASLLRESVAPLVCDFK